MKNTFKKKEEKECPAYFLNVLKFFQTEFFSLGVSTLPEFSITAVSTFCLIPSCDCNKV